MRNSNVCQQGVRNIQLFISASGGREGFKKGKENEWNFVPERLTPSNFKFPRSRLSMGKTLIGMVVVVEDFPHFL